jgi:uncharacterized protein YuzE
MPGAPSLTQVLPDLVADLETALLHLGRGDLVEQMRRATLDRWTYDDFADTTYLFFGSTGSSERLSLYDELGINVDTDDRGQLCGIEVLDGRAIAARLDKAGA